MGGAAKTAEAVSADVADLMDERVYWQRDTKLFLVACPELVAEYRAGKVTTVL